jgi:hypothetical protein
MSIYEILPAFDLTQSVHAKISIGMQRVVKFKISRIPLSLIGLETRLGWRTDRKYLRNPNLNEVNDYHITVLRLECNYEYLKSCSSAGTPLQSTATGSLLPFLYNTHLFQSEVNPHRKWFYFKNAWWKYDTL